jgi:hypothetical protein
MQSNRSFRLHNQGPAGLVWAEQICFPSTLRNRRASIFFLSALVVLILGLASCTTESNVKPRVTRKEDLEEAHGLKLVPSACNFQQARATSRSNHDVVSLFEMDQSEIPVFLGQFTVKSRSWPANSGPADPCVNPEKLWTPASGVAAAGKEFGGLQRTWRGGASPIEMLVCDSVKGDLQVEIWSVDDHTLIKLYTEGK